jgi:uncharacterized cupin superfamily protein
MTAKIGEANVVVVTGTRYPPPYDVPCLQRRRARLGDATGLTQFGVNRLQLPPGCWSSQRHWHSAEDEFVYVLEGEVVLVTDAGEELLRAGEAAGFKAGTANGHQLQNRAASEAVVLEVGSRRPGEDAVEYPDIDLQIPKGQGVYAHRDGRLYDSAPPRR